MTASLRLRRPLLAAPVLVAAACAVAALAGCSGSGSGSPAGSPAGPTGAAGALGATGGPSVTASVGIATGAPQPSASPSPSTSAPTSVLEAIKRKDCTPADFVRYAGLAGGALRTYVATPAEKGTLTGAAVPQAQVAVVYAEVQLKRAKAALKGCPASTTPLQSVLDQNVKLLNTFAAELKAGKVPDNRPGATLAMYENVVSQATRLRLAVKETVPTPAELAS